jgi:uncharacterized protein (DUF1501 family)
MGTTDKDSVVVVVELGGGNDYLNTVIPYTDPNYYDNRKVLRVEEDEVLKLDSKLGLNPNMGPMKDLYESGDLAIIHGVGYENASRSHFRSMDIWHTCEPVSVADDGWIGRAEREIDPKGENPVGIVSVGYGLPRALVADGVPVASVSDLASFGLYTDAQHMDQRDSTLDLFREIYSPAIGSGPVGEVMSYLGQTGRDALKSADILKGAIPQYKSSVEYGADNLGQSLRTVANIHSADLGARFFYTTHGGFDTHASQMPMHSNLWTQVSRAVADFWNDMEEQGASDNIVMLLFSEFGRRVKENGQGTDHGSGGVAFAVGPRVKGGMYSEYPETRAEALADGDLAPAQDFRGVYSTLLEDWMGLDSGPLVNGRFEKPGFIIKG